VVALRRRFLTLLDEEARLERMARIVGSDALPRAPAALALCASLIDEAFLRQSALSEVDRVCSPARQAAMMRILGRFVELAERAVAAGASVEAIGSLACVRTLKRMREEIGDGEVERIGALAADVERQFASLVPRLEKKLRLTVEGAATRLEGPLLFLRRTVDAGLGDAVEVRGTDGRARVGRVAALDAELMTIEVLESTSGLALDDTVVRFVGEPLSFGLAPSILGRVFNGVGQPIDGGPPVAARARYAIDGLPLNPVARASPRDFIETGISTVDLMNSLVRGQKLPLFSGGGLPHDRLAIEIAGHARLRGAAGDDRFAIVFAASASRGRAPSISGAASSAAARSSAPRCS
jgi:vacuolar-type H+-ATPase catalytic subunit A/Vma1